MSYEYKKDCKSFPSVFTCDIMKSEGQKDCKDCLFYEKIDKKILIIKLGAIGDVIRTTPIVDALRKKHGYNSQITWIVDNSAKDFIKDKVDRAWSYTPDIGYRLMFEKFDVVYSLEVDTPTTFLANLAKAKEKYGFYLSDQGHPEVFNEKARYYLDRALSDHANKNNRKTYVQMIFDICELPYENNTYTLTNYKKGYGLELKNKCKLKNKILGINIGSSPRWPSKRWHLDLVKEFCKKLPKQYDILILGGKAEEQTQNKLVEELNKQGIKAYKNDPNNSIPEFISVIDICDTIVTSDSMALHIAIGLNKKVISLFFCTPPWEIENKPNVIKLQSKLLESNYYSNDYSEELVRSISVEEVLKHV